MVNMSAYVIGEYDIDICFVGYPVPLIMVNPFFQNIILLSDLAP